MGIHHQHIKQLASTHNKLWEWSAKEELPSFFTISTGYQTQGKGQDNNSWESERDANILLSSIVYPDFVNASDVFLLSRCISLGIVVYLQSKGIEQVRIKWPNDIYVGRKKIAGILIQNSIQGSWLQKSMFSIGLNLNQEKFVSDAPNPISLKQLTKKNYVVATEIELLMRSIEHEYAILQIKPEMIIQRYHKLMYQLGEWRSYWNKDFHFTAKIKGVDEFGRLILQRKDQTTEVYDLKDIRFALI
ncbi:MAG: biotin--[acetyl-CoA-carboxylase] ligase [Bacteroidetes bacterium 4572_77]|nr:MAG: biotin--[acetyl-CoA-carboxylase] ligase [Bacteroidetes bacterium 4572_77]